MSLCSPCVFYSITEYTSYIGGNTKSDIKIAKLPKRVKLKNGQWIYLQ